MVFTLGKADKGNLFTYLVLILIALCGMVYGHTLLNTYPELRVWDATNFLLLLLGIPFLFLQVKARLPDFWQKDISPYQRFVLPLLIGLNFGVLDILLFKIILHPEAYDVLPPFLQPFPYSLFLYLSGAFEVEVFYRLIPLTLLMLAGVYFRRGKYLDYFFWTGAVLTSLREPLEQLSADPAWVVGYAFLSGFLMNFLQAVCYRKAGFLASLVVRLAHYLMWHILLGIYVEYYELVPQNILE